MVHAKTFARIETPDGEYTMSKREFDELRMLLWLRKEHGITPPAEPPVFEEDYNNLLDFADEHVSDDGFISDERP